jgi:hypothetical protein
MNRGIILSILIPSIPARFDKLNYLLNAINSQKSNLERDHPSLRGVEIIYDDGERFLDGGLSIGKKRESLVNRATGKYLCFCDDDESIAPNYLETLVRLCQLDRDVCTFKVMYKDDNYWSVIDMSIYYKDQEATPDREVRRNVWQVCAIRSSIAKKHSFEDINYDEDTRWVEKVRKDIKSEAKTNAVLLQYNHSVEHSESDKIARHG